MRSTLLSTFVGLTFGLSYTLAPAGIAQGSDDCSTPTPIAGSGVFAFDLSTATLGMEGQNEVVCLNAGTTGIDNDVWFAWTPDVDGCAHFETCVTTTTDTKMAIYPGVGCPAPNSALACNDDFCSYQSSMDVEVTGGTTYTIQIGTFPGLIGGQGSLHIDIPPCPAPVVYPANGHYYLAVGGFLPWELARDAAEEATFLGIPGHLATLTDLGEDTFVYYQLDGGALGTCWTGLYQDLNAPDYSEPAGGWRWVTGEPFVYENWTPGEPNNGSGIEHFGGYYPAEQWNDFSASDSTVQKYVIEWETDTGDRYCFGDGTGNFCPCGNLGAPGQGCSNSTGGSGLLRGMGLPTAVPDPLIFRAENLIPGQTALLFVALNATNGGSGSQFGDGLRCAGGGLVRLGVKVPDAAGVAIWGPGLAAQGGWGPGDLRRFQTWYRDPPGPCGSAFNLTNGVEISFQL